MHALLFYLNITQQRLEPIPEGAKVVNFGRHTPSRLWINSFIYNFTPTFQVIWKQISFFNTGRRNFLAPSIPAVDISIPQGDKHERIGNTELNDLAG